MYRNILLILIIFTLFGCAAVMTDEYYERGVSFYEQGEYYTAIQEFSKYPQKHSLYAESQKFIVMSQARMNELLDDLTERAYNKWKDDYYSLAIELFYEIRRINPEEADIDDIIKEAHSVLEKTMLSLKKEFEDNRANRDIFGCKQVLERMERIFPGHDITQKTVKNYNMLKDIVLQKAFITIEDHMKRGRDENIEQADLLVEYMRGIDDRDQRTLVIARRLDDFKEDRRRRSEIIRQARERRSFRHLYEQGLEKYEQGNLKEAVDIWENALKYGTADNKLLDKLNNAKRELSATILNILKKAEFYFELEDYSKARELFERVLEIDMQNEKAKEFIRKIIIIQQ